MSDSEQIDPSALPPPVTTVNKDGTKTTISYRLDDQGRKVRVTRKTRTTVHKERVNPVVAERREWAKFGLEKGKPKGPQPDTTSVGENIVFRPSRDWKNVQAEEAKAGGGKVEEKSLKEQLRDKKVKCRICQGEHFTARCPFKDTMAPADDGATPVADPMAEDDESKAAGGLGAGGSSYVPPHLRKGAQGAGERMGGKFERDDQATLRVTNVSSSPDQKIFVRTHTDKRFPIHRFPKWRKNQRSVNSSSGSVASPGYSWLKTERRNVPKALLLYLMWTGQMLREHVKRWTVSVIDI